MLMLFPKTSRTVMEEALTKATGFPRDQFSDPMIVAKPIEKIEDREITESKKHIGLGVFAIIGVIGYLVFKK